MLVSVLLRPGSEAAKTIVYVATCAMVDYFSKVIPAIRACSHLKVLALHGKMVPKKRTSMQSLSSHRYLLNEIFGASRNVRDVPNDEPLRAFHDRCGSPWPRCARCRFGHSV